MVLDELAPDIEADTFGKSVDNARRQVRHVLNGSEADFADRSMVERFTQTDTVS